MMHVCVCVLYICVWVPTYVQYTYACVFYTCVYGYLRMYNTCVCVLYMYVQVPIYVVYMQCAHISGDTLILECSNYKLSEGGV